MNIIFKIIIYFQESIKLLRKNPRYFNIELIKYFPYWLISLGSNKSPLKDKRPWISFGAILFLEKILKKDMQVYEYGSGGSTLFFGKRVKCINSVEHDPNWFNKVVEEININGFQNCHIRLVEPIQEMFIHKNDISDPDAYIADDEKYRGMSFLNYAASIDSYPDGFFDIVIIDGRARPSCFKHSEKKVKRNGYLILDNAERPYYNYIHKTLDKNKWVIYDFYGPVPYSYGFCQTCIWQKPNSSDI